jgi:hypothetical protein
MGIIAMQIVGADPIPPGESPWMTESQMLILLFTINLAVNSAILAAVLKVMRLKLGAKFVFVTFILTLGGLLLDTAANAASSNAIMLYILSFAMVAPYASLLVKLAYRIDLKRGLAAGVAVGLISNPGILALMG